MIENHFIIIIFVGHTYFFKIRNFISLFILGLVGFVNLSSMNFDLEIYFVKKLLHKIKKKKKLLLS